MRPGKLRHLITIQSRTETLDAYGGTVHVWANFATAWAKILPLSGRDLIAAQAAMNETTTRFFIRYLDWINASMRIVSGGKCYDITAIIDTDEKHEELQIMTKTGLTDISTEIIQGPDGGVIDTSVVVDGGVY
jgi:SPP1 family predicted phage head-tail adaptor